MQKVKESSLEGLKTSQKDYTELVYWVWMYFGVVVLAWFIGYEAQTRNSFLTIFGDWATKIEFWK